MADLSSGIVGSVNYHNISAKFGAAKSGSAPKANSYQSSDNSVSKNSSANFLNKLKNLENTSKASLSNSDIKSANQINDENGTDLALKKIAVDFESHFMGSMWQLALNYPSRVYEGGLGEEIFSQELTSELVKKATVITDPRGNQVMGPIASKIYDELKQSK